MTAITLGPAVLDVSGIRAGDINQYVVTLTRNGSPFDLTGLDITAQARKKATDPDPAPLNAVVDVIDATAGKLSVRWPGADVTAVLDGGSSWSGVWDLQVVTTGSDPLTVLAGRFAAVVDVTRP